MQGATHVNGISDLFRALGPARLGAIAAVGLGLIGFFFFISMRLSTPQMAMLYNGLDMTDSAAIVSKLEAAAVPYQIGNDGATILVPEDKVLRLRMTMAEQGIPAGGSVGYEIFDRSDHLGTSSFVQSVNQVRALEGELARTIRAIDGVESARVHLVLPERELFSRQTREPSASIALKTKGGSLTHSQVGAIQNLVAASVPGLAANRISIIDQKGRLLAKGEGENAADAYASTLEEKRGELEQRMRNEIEALLEKSVGLGKVRAEVSADIDLNRVTTNSEIYDPEGQVVRSTVTVNDSNSSLENGESGAVSVANNLPEGQADNGSGVKSNSSGSRSEETVNYEITKTIKTQIQEAGNVKRLSVAVLVDGDYAAGKDGNMVYKARSADELAKLTALVRSAVGYDEARGDKVEVVNMKFAEVADGPVSGPVEINLYGFKKEDMFRAAELGILGVVGILVILLVLRPLVMRLVTMPEGFKPAAQAAGMAQLAGPQAQAALAGPSYTAVAQFPGSLEENMIPRDDEGRPLTARQIAEKPGGLETAIDVAAIEGKVQTSAVKKVGELVDRHPDESAAVIRSWLFGK